MRRKGTKRTVHTDQAGNRQDPEGMDWGAWQQRSTTVPVDPWRTAKPRCARTFGTQALPGGSAHLSEHRRKAGHAASLRHSTAMDLLHHGVDQAVIALWLGHESVETTQVYIHADMRLKEKALARVAAPDVPTGRFKPDDQLLAFLEGL